MGLATGPFIAAPYHIVWVPTHRHRILTGPIREWVHESIQFICSYAGCELTQLSIQHDHAHLILMVPTKTSLSDFMGRLKGQTSIKVYKRFKSLREKSSWGEHFRVKSYRVDTIGLEAEMIQNT